MSRIKTETWPAIWTLIRVIEAGSLAAAARELGVTPSGVSKQLSRLEKKLETRLLHRTTRQVRPTDEGLALYDHCRPLFEAFDEAQEAVQSMGASLDGLIRVAATPAFGRAVLAEAVGEFLERHPGLSVELTFSRRRIDLVQEGLDLAIREGALPDSDLVGVKLCETRLVLCAAPGYLARRPAPMDLEGLADHDTIAVPPIGLEAGFRSIGESFADRVRLRPRILVNDFFSIRDLVVAGRGIGPLPDYLARRDLARGRLIRILPEERFPEIPITALRPSRRFQPRRVGALVDYLLERLGPKASGISRADS